MRMDPRRIICIGNDTGKLTGPETFHIISSDGQQMQSVNSTCVRLGRRSESQFHVGHELHRSRFSVIVEVRIKKFHVSP